MIRPLFPLALVLATSLAGGCVLPSYEVTTSSSSTSSGSGGAGASSGGGGQGASGGITATGGGGSGGSGGAMCGDTSSDPANCGRCGHACPGGLCIGGECEIQVMQASSTGELYRHLAVDESDVYWVSGGDVLRMPKSGNAGDTPIPISTLGNAEFLAVDGTNVYFTSFDNGMVHARTKAGGMPYAIAQSETYPTGLTVLGSNVYWARHDDTGLIREHDLLGSSTGDLSVAEPFPFYVATDGVEIYWTYRGTQDMGGVQKSGMGQAVDVVSAQSAPSGLAVDATHVYWLSYDGSFARTEKAGGAPVASIGPAGKPSSLYAGDVVLDATHVYWPGPGATSCQVPPCTCDPAPCGRIWRALKTSLVPEVFAEGDWGDVAGMAADALYVYWTTGQDGRLMRKSKLGGG